MFSEYVSGKGVTQEVDDFVTPLCNEEAMELDDALATLGYLYRQSYGDEGASLEVYAGEEHAKYAAVVIAAIGPALQWYVMPRFHDLLGFMKEYAQTVRTLAEMID